MADKKELFNAASKLPSSVIGKETRVTADVTEYKRCMEILKARIMCIEDLLNNKPLIPALMFKTETIFLQFRLLIELLYLTTIPAKHKKYLNEWSRAEKESAPVAIRKFLGQNPKISVEECFPYAIRLHQRIDYVEIEFVHPKPLAEQEIYDFFNFTHRYLHEPNPYKKTWAAREAECNDLLLKAGDMLKKIWALMHCHGRVSELDDGEGLIVYCTLGNRNVAVQVATVIKGG